LLFASPQFVCWIFFGFLFDQKITNLVV